MKSEITEHEFVVRMHKINPKIKIMSHFIQTKGKRYVKVMCAVCRHRWEPCIWDLLHGHGCSVCAHKQTAKKLALSQNEFKERVKSLLSDIKVLGKYRSEKAYIEYKCMICGRIQKTQAENLLEGKGCWFCGQEKAHAEHLITTSEFKARVHNINPTITILSRYKGRTQHVTVRCNVCGYTWSANAGHLMDGEGCPHCNRLKSRGEQVVERYLKQHGYIYKWQYVLDGCCDKGPLPFDFAVFNKDGSLKCLIEYEGCQHYMWRWHKLYPDREIPSIFGSSSDGVNGIHRRDMIKQQYCLDHSIMLIYINHPERSAESSKPAYIEKLVGDTLADFLP